MSWRIRFVTVGLAVSFAVSLAGESMPGAQIGQDNRAGPGTQTGSGVRAIVGARIVTLAGPPIEGGTVLIRDGKIAGIGTNVSVPADAERIDGKGLHVYPGLFDASTQLGMTEFDSVAATVDTTEIGDAHPQLVAAAGVHPASEHIPVTRANGVTHAVAMPGVSSGSGRGASATALIAGQASVIHLDGWTVEEMLVQQSVGTVVNWPRLATTVLDVTTFSQRQRPFSEVKQEYDKQVADLSDWVERARRYSHATQKAPASTERDLKLEALGPIVRGERPLLINASERRQIEAAVAFSVDRKLKMVLLNGRDAAELKDLLARHSIPVILGPTQALPATEDRAYDAPFTLARDLTAAGIKVAIATFNSADSRTLPYEAGNAVAYGLPWEDGLKAITLHPAQILGISDRLGSLEPGKLANLIVTTGDPLEITTQVRHVFIRGQSVSLDNRHLRSYERWKQRPKPRT